MKRFTNVILSLTMAFGTAAAAAPASALGAAAVVPGVQVKVDQVGYLSDLPKVAFITGGGAASTFELISLDTNAVVMTGNVSAPAKDDNSGDTVRQADFSNWKQSGMYVVHVDGAGDSYPLRIGGDVYRNPLLLAMRSYTLGRSATDIRDGLSGLVHAPGHTQDRRAKMYFSDEFHNKDEVIDVGGGWYDAGDYGKYIPTATVSTAQMLLAYELAPAKFYKGQMMFPAGVTSSAKLPDLLAETKFELDWMRKMQRPDGAVYLKVSGKQWPGFIRPEADTQDRYIFGLSTYGTAQYAGVMAMAARIYKPFDDDYAEQLLASAAKAQRYLEKHPQPEFRVDKDQDSGSGGYRKDTDAEERLWAAAELLKTTGKAEYDSYIQKNLAAQLTQKPGAISWLNSSLLGQYAYVTSAKADAASKEKAKAAITLLAEEIIAQIQSDGYRAALRGDEYNWGSAKGDVAKGDVLIIANTIAPNAAYVQGALDQLHYVFGRNATGYSYMTGAGTKMPLHPHHRMNAGAKAYVPGLVVGGPNKYGGDPAIDKILKEASGGVPPAKAYIDVQDSYSTNEYAIDYTAPVLFALAYFTKGDIISE